MEDQLYLGWALVTTDACQKGHTTVDTEINGGHWGSTHARRTAPLRGGSRVHQPWPPFFSRGALALNHARAANRVLRTLRVLRL